MNKYLLAHKNGIYLQRNRSGFLDLLSNLKSLDLKDIKEDINSIGLCVTANSHRVFVIPITTIPKDCEKANKNQLSYDAHYAVTVFRVKALLSYHVKNSKKEEESAVIAAILGLLEDVFSNSTFNKEKWVRK